jgi:hypothetical protein
VDTVRVPGGLNVSGTATASVFDAASGFDIAASRVLSIAGTGNLFAGVGAAAANTGSANAFLGAGAGQANQTGNENTFLGSTAGLNSGAGDGSSSASFNTFVGSGAGLGNGLGASNTAIGAHADVGPSGLDHATAIGADAVANNSNTVVLGRDADKVLIPGTGLSVVGTIGFATLGLAGGGQLCRNSRFEIAACSSSLRYKTDVSSYTHGMDLVGRLRPINFRWKEDGAADLGLAAEEVAAVEPLLVTHNDKGQIEGVKYDHLAAVFINALKEQQAQIEAQREELRRQAEEIAALKSLVTGGRAAAARQ